MDAIHPHTLALIRKLDSIAPLAPEEKAALLRLPLRLKAVAVDQDIVREGDTPFENCLIVEGFACRYNTTAEGTRQIPSFHISGDLPDLPSLHLEVMDTSIGTVTPCRVGFIQHEDLWRLCMRHPRIAAAFWRETLIEGAIFREWVVNAGRRETYNRMAHVFCEMLVRLRAVGLVEGYACDLPITQGEFADALGVTTVHVNRVLQEMRADGLIELNGDRLNIPDWEMLKQVGDFDPTYLHLEQDQAAA